jgi:Zn ribbon nucleic-acid-binding protein
MHGTQAFYKIPLQFATSAYCPKCNLEKRLSYIVPERLGYDLWTFECTNCGLEETSLRSISYPEWRQPRARKAA